MALCSANCPLKQLAYCQPKAISLQNVRLMEQNFLDFDFEKQLKRTQIKVVKVNLLIIIYDKIIFSNA